MEGPGEEVGKTGPVGGGVQLGSKMAEEARALCPALGFWMEQRWLDGISEPPQLAGTGLEGWGWRPGRGEVEKAAHRTGLPCVLKGRPRKHLACGEASWSW